MEMQETQKVEEEEEIKEASPEEDDFLSETRRRSSSLANPYERFDLNEIVKKGDN